MTPRVWRCFWSNRGRLVVGLNGRWAHLEAETAMLQAAVAYTDALRGYLAIKMTRAERMSR